MTRDSVIILAHHYQRPEIIAAADHVGDSFELARIAASAEHAAWVVFSGVRFMAEAASVLCGKGKTVVMPNPAAGCPLAASASLPQVERAWKDLASLVPEREITPITYMNSDIGLKAFCGVRGGTVCTSANTARALAWAMKRTPRIFFFPDRQLGLNTSASLDLREDEIVIWDPEKRLGGLSAEAVRKARLILWNGGCYVHTRFTVDHVKEARARHANAVIHVHPECLPDVTALADGSGSTSFLVRKAREARPGDTLVIGTELSLVRRLAAERPDVVILPLAESICDDMHATTLEHLEALLSNLDAAPAITVDDRTAEGALLALNRMLHEI